MATRILQEPLELDVPSVYALQLDGTCGSAPQEIAAAMGPGFGRLMAFAAQHGLQVIGPPRVIYTHFDAAGFGYTIAFPIVPAESVQAEPPLHLGELAAAKALRFTHAGPYEALRVTYDGITAWLMEHGRMHSEADWEKYMPMWEEYVTDPANTPPQELVTYVYLPVPA